MKKFVLALVLCGFAGLTVGCGGEEAKKPTDKKPTTPTTPDKK